MDTETPSSRSSGRRARPWLLAMLGLVLVGFVGYRLWPDAAVTPVASQPPSRQPQGGTPTANPEELKVRLGDLAAKRPDAGDVERNPFRFRPPPAPPAPPPQRVQPQIDLPPQPPPPPPIPPIPLKFMGTVEGPGIKLAALTDCKGFTYSGREGEPIDGRYRLVRIQVETIVMEYLNGTGRITIRKSGECPK
jgi:hypothetical protein